MDAHLYLVCFVEEKTEVCEHDPQFLPSISSLEFPQQFSTHLILKYNRNGVRTCSQESLVIIQFTPLCFFFF